MTTATVICDSVAPHGGRLTTLQLRFPRFILSQFNTYGSIAKNARSSRAVPTEKIIAEVEDDPVMPARWGKRAKGMVASNLIDYGSVDWCEGNWLAARKIAVQHAKAFVEIGVAKEIVNRLLEPWMWVDVVATATHGAWGHYLNQRTAHDTQPEHQELARAIGIAIRDGVPRKAGYWQWHLPYVTDDEYGGIEWDDLDAIHGRWLPASVRRVRRVSYSPFDGRPETPESDKAKHDESLNAGHWSCFEHQGEPSAHADRRSGRMTGWIEYRQRFNGQVRPDFDYGSLCQKD